MATETEIEAMARALSHQAQEEPNVMWRNWTSQAVVAAEALDRVRADDARDTEALRNRIAAELRMLPADFNEWLIADLVLKALAGLFVDVEAGGTT